MGRILCIFSVSFMVAYSCSHLSAATLAEHQAIQRVRAAHPYASACMDRTFAHKAPDEQIMRLVRSVIWDERTIVQSRHETLDEHIEDYYTNACAEAYEGTSRP